MLRTAQLLPLEGLSTLGSGPARFQTAPPACYRASWQMPGPAPYRQATTRVANTKNTVDYATVSPPIPLGARSHPGTAVRDGTDAVRDASGCEPGPIPIDGGHRRRQP